LQCFQFHPPRIEDRKLATNRRAVETSVKTWNREAMRLLAAQFMLPALAISVLSQPSIAKPALGVVPIMPTFCTSLFSNAEPYYVPVTVGGEEFRVLLDTGSSNFAIASERCDSCDLGPKYKAPLATGAPSYNISYGTGSIQNVETKNRVAVGALALPANSTTFDAIVAQDTSFGFNLFPPKTDRECYDTYAGLWGLAYQGQDAGPAPGGGTTNGTTVPLFDQMVAQLDVPNAFAVEMCPRYPYGCADRRRRDNSTWAPSSSCGRRPVGALTLGGYARNRTAGPMLFTPISVEIHYDVRMLAARACGDAGCQEVNFPDPVDGASEEDCRCTSSDCREGTVDFCTFTVLDTGTDRIYMNTARNAEALLTTMQSVGMVHVDGDWMRPARHGEVDDPMRQFWFNKTAIPRSARPRVSPRASLELEFARIPELALQSAGAQTRPDLRDSPRLWVEVSMASIFLETGTGLVQNGIQGDLDQLLAFQKAKFPTLLGDTFFQGKVVFHDRSRSRIGFAPLRKDLCGASGDDMSGHVPRVEDIDALGANSRPTPGAGCQRGTGSGGGCR
jgi:hypothetical protein